MAVILMFCFAQLTLSYFFPDRRTDFEVWSKYFVVKDAIYDIMFFLSFLIVFWNTTKATKSLAAFIVIVSGGSVIDKVIFNLNMYLWSDIIMILMAAIVSVHLYRTRWKN
jgi:hypothetical protein